MQLIFLGSVLIFSKNTVLKGEDDKKNVQVHSGWYVLK